MSFDPEKITFFAKTDARGQQLPFGIKAKDRQRHMYIVGKTGMGKSTLLENMAAQDIKNGEGMAFIDPHGSAAETLLDYVPENRVNDVIYFAPFDLANPISFNVMEDVGPDKRHLVVSGLMSTFKKIWVDAWSARMEYILTNALLALIEYPDTTLLSVNRLFSDKAYRARVVDYIKDPAVKAFWTEEFANYTDRFAAEALPAIQNKIGQFTGNPLIRNIIGQPHSSFDIRKIMDEKKILIMNLSKGLVGETNANLLGSMLTTRIYLAAMSRADLPVAEMRTMPNFYFYVDEFQSFANSTFANILSEARKYHLNLIIAHQYIEQMEEEVRSAVFGNVGTTIAFRVGPFDAEVLETVFAPRFVATDLVNLGFAQIYLTLMIDGIGSQPFSAVTLPPIELARISCRDMVIASSRKNFTKPREDVEKIIADLHTPIKVEPPVKKNNNNNYQGQNNNYKANGDQNKKPSEIKFDRNTKGGTWHQDKPKNIEPTKKIEVQENTDSNFKPKIYNQIKNEKESEIKEEKIKKDNINTPSLESLRSVLGQIKDSSLSETSSTTPDESEKINKFNKNQDNYKANQRVFIKKDDNNQKSADLKSALASLLKSHQNTKNVTDSGDKIEKTISEFKKTNEESDKDLKVNFLPLPKTIRKITLESKFNNGKKKELERSELSRLHKEAEDYFSHLENNVNNGASDDSVFLQRQVDNNSRQLAKKNFTNKGFVTKKNYNNKNKHSVDSDNPLSPKKIQKRLRHPHHERSPFAS